MSRKVTYYCDGCGKQRGEANHWWIVRTGKPSISIYPFDPIDSGTEFDCYCGQGCAMKAVSEWMQSQRSQL